MAIRLADKRSVPHTLLLADDSVTIQRVIELTFADEDIQVVAVSDGDQAIERLEATTPDIVLADIGMPGRNGYEVAQFMRRTPRLAHIPVVLLTGAFEPVDQERAAQAGCDGVLAKPFEPQMVIGRVRELLARPRAAAAADSSGATTPPEATAPAGDSRPQTFEASGPGGGELNAYFDRLDAAFANLEGGHPAVDAGSGRRTRTMGSGCARSPSRGARTVARDGRTGARAVGAGFSLRSPAAGDVLHPAGTGGSHRTDRPARRCFECCRGAVAVAAAEAFGAAVAGRRVRRAARVRTGRSAVRRAAHVAGHDRGAGSTAPVPPPPAEITDELIEAVTRRVLDRLSDQVVRETVSEIVSAVAERLISEEIARIKAAIE